MINILRINISSAVLASLAVASAANVSAGNTRSCEPATDDTSPRVKRYAQSSRICVDGKTFSLQYNYGKRELSVHRQGSAEVTLDRISKGFSPDLILGGESLIRFLPMNLQPYLAQQKILYLSSVRTTGGNGSGQCGGGLETFLNVLDISADRPRKISSLLIASCAENIFLAEDGAPDDNFFNAFANEAGHLTLKFLGYKNRTEDNPVAALSSDFRSLDFIEPE